jgi:hypothetical protein
VGAITGPLMLIAAGVLFTIDHFGPFRFGQTWPVLLILFGLARAVAYLVPSHTAGNP